MGPWFTGPKIGPLGLPRSTSCQQNCLDFPTRSTPHPHSRCFLVLGRTIRCVGKKKRWSLRWRNFQTCQNNKCSKSFQFNGDASGKATIETIQIHCHLILYYKQISTISSLITILTFVGIFTCYIYDIATKEPTAYIIYQSHGCVLSYDRG